MTMVVALCVLALHVYCNTFNGKRLDEMIEDEVKEIKMKEEIRANVENVAVAVMKSGTESQVTKLTHSYLIILHKLTHPYLITLHLLTSSVDHSHTSHITHHTFMLSIK